MKLGTLLIRDGVINLDQLEAALRAQVLFGGKLGTNLVELGHLSLDTLAEYLGRTLAVPAASQELFEAADPAAVAMIPVALAQKHTAFALAFEGEPRRLIIALADPRDQQAIAVLRQTCGMEVVPYIAPELRISFYLERHYGLERKVRVVRVARGPSGATPAPVAASGTASPATVALPAPVPAPHPVSRGVSIQPRAGSLPPSQAAPAPATTPPVALIALADVLRRLDEARGRDQIGEAMLDYARGRAEGAVLFLLKEGLALGWRGFAAGLDAAALDSFSVPLGAPSCLARAYDTHMPWRGRPIGGGLDDRLFTQLRLPGPPDEVVVVPVLIGARVVNLFYAHAPGRGAFDEPVIEGLIAVAEAAGDAYLRMIQSIKAHSAE